MYVHEILTCLVIPLIIALTHGQTFTTDPCSPSEYKTLNEPHRSTGFLSAPPLAPLCDMRLRRGWYRFTSQAGGDMPTTCQETNRCGTTKPIWVNGSNPSFEDGIIMRRICVNMNSSNPQEEHCCEYSEDIFMKHCGSFFVYYLYPTIDCDMAYCAGNIPPCPVGKWSNTSFPPCKDLFPVLESPPIITGPEIQRSNLFGFSCEVVYDDDDPDQRFEVVWTFNGQSDPTIPPQVLSSPQKTVTLDVSLLSHQLDKNVACQVRSFFAGRESDKSGFLTSNETYFGMQSPPVLSGPILLDNRSFIFQCDVFPNSTKPGQAIEVVWVFNGQQDTSLPTQVISGSNHSVILDGSHLKGHLNTKVGCKTRVVFPGTNTTSGFIFSNTYFAGIQVFPNPLVINEDESYKNFSVVSTIPIVCDFHQDCCITIKSIVDHQSVISFEETCEHRICSSDWNPQTKLASVMIGVLPNRNILVAGSRATQASLEVSQLSGSGSYINIFEGYKLNQIQITVQNGPVAQCSLTGDPHITGFDLRVMHDLYRSGDFIIYESPHRDFMIQIRTIPCGSGAVTCICGIVVKEKNDVIKIDYCNTEQPLSEIAYKLSSGTVIQRSSDGYRFGIYLSSGTEVKIENCATFVYSYLFVYMNVYISIPAFDKGRGRGICGTNDGNPGNDFTYPDGRVQTVCSQRCQPNEFYEAWRVSGNSSLFEVVPEPAVTTDSRLSCSCIEKLNENSSNACSERQHIQTANTACSNCAVVTNLLAPSYIPGVGWVKPGTNKPYPPFVPLPVKPVDPNKQWPNDQGITEAQATDLCSQAVNKSQLYSQCQKFEQIKNSVISDCLADILVGGTTAFVDDITSSYTSQCQLKLAADPDNYVINKDGQQVIKPELVDICPTQCLKHGQCGEKGQCVCQDGWEGETCLIDSSTGPQLVEINGGAVCDVQQRRCDFINVNVANIHFLDPLTAKIQAVNEQGDDVGDADLQTVSFLSPATITCKLPPLRNSSQLYNISATKNGSLFGNELTFRVFDGTCLDCDLATCREKNTACHIANVCYKNGEADISNRNKTCDITKSTTKWTTSRSDQDRFPLLNDSPVFTGPIFQQNGTLSFLCEVIYNGTDPEQVFEVVWTFNGQSHPSVPSQLLFGRDRIASLDISLLKSLVDTQVGCRVRSYYTDSDINKSQFLLSNSTYFGIQTPPALTGPTSLDNTSFTFQCQIISNNESPSQEIEVVWTFDGQQDLSLTPEIVTGNNSTVELNGTLLMGHMGTQVGCQARLVYPGSDVKSRFIPSNTYFAGIQISPEPLEISEIDFEKNITVTSTIPIICHHDLECCLIFRLNVNKTAAVSLMNSCEYKMCSTDWDPLLKRASIQIGVVPKRNILLQGSRNVLLALDVITPANSGSYLQTFENYQPKSLQITIKDETAFRCSLTGDPHIMGFDFKYMYDLYKSGDFVAYEASARDFMIQIRTVPCGGGTVACICGIAVRERNDVVKLSKCENPASTTIDIAYKLSPDTIVQRSSDGQSFGIYLPSGSEVKIEAGGTNVYISIPAFDKGQGRGLCGTNDGVDDNDFTHPDGTVDPACNQRCIPDAFLESWRVAGNDSLFEVVPDPVADTGSTVGSFGRYCSCVESADGTSRVSCSAREHVQTANTACPNCPVITNILTPSYVVGVGWVRPGTNKPDPPFVHPEITQVVNPNMQWPNVQGITEAQARDLCTKAIQKSPLYSQCQNFLRLTDSLISDCLADILHGGTTAFLDEVTASFTSQCQLTLAQNPDNYVTNHDGQQVIKPGVIDICPAACLKHGQCGDKGQCICQKGWEGETCLIESGKGPQLIAIKSGELCDISQTRCDLVNIDITNVIFGSNITCRVQIIDEQGNNSVGSPILKPASFLTPTTISCVLPALEQSPQKYNISATKDGSIFGNEISLRVFDGTCLDCDLVGCKEKTTACHINNVCYKNGDVDKFNENKTCDITKSTSQWTTRRSEQGRTPLLDTPPKFSGPHINGSNFFQCEVVYDQYDPEQVFEVTWTFNGRPYPSLPSHLLSGGARILTLDINLLRDQVDTYVGCQVRTFYQGYQSSASRYLASNTTYFGIQTPPLLTGPILHDNKSFVFQCDVIYGSTEASQEIEVVWTFDGQQNPASPPRVIKGSNRTIVLDGRLLQGRLDTKVGCQARLVYPESNVSTTFVTSNTYFAGIQAQPSPLAVSENDLEKYITLTSTIPVMCDNQDIDCCLTFKLNMNDTSVVSLINTCDHKICYSDWDDLWKKASVKIGIIATRNLVVRGSNNVFMSFQVITPAGQGSYSDIFQGYKPGRLQVTVTDEMAFKCSFTGDPHIMGFDLRGGYNLFLSGDFVAYTAPVRDFMIQVRTVPCARVACVCGIAVRERNNVIRVDKCNTQYSGLAEVSIAHVLDPGTVVQRSTDGQRFGIYLPSGSEVRIERGGLDVYITIPAFDKGQGRGICGTNDGTQDNDLMYPDGSVDPAHLLNPFFESWRVTGNSSLFEAVPDPNNVTDSTNGSSPQFCSCQQSSNGSSSVVCSARQHIQRTNTACPNCPDITDALVPAYVVGVGWVRPGTNKTDPPFVHPQIPPVDSNKQWPADNGMTESQARDLCTQAMQKSQLYQQCQGTSNLPTSIMSDCLADILYGGTTEFLDDITSSFTSQCQLHLAENPDNYITAADGQQVMKPELLDHICPAECFKHGQCGQRGQCQCQPGWEGETCLIESGKGPQLLDIQGGNSCDITVRSCESFHIGVDNINYADKLQCVVQQVDTQSNNSVGDRILTTAVFLTPNIITCTLPPLSLSTKRYNISATKDGVLFGNELPLRIYDGTCLICDPTGCKEKTTACHINNVCYKNGQTKTNDPNKICDVGKNIFDWTSKTSESTDVPNLTTSTSAENPALTTIPTTAAASTPASTPTPVPTPAVTPGPINPAVTPGPIYPARPNQETPKPCQFCFGG